MQFSAKQIYKGGASPPWYYGFTYRQWHLDNEVWLPIPFNFLIRWHRYCRMRWNAWRGKGDSMHVRLRRMARAQARWAYEAGIKHGEERAIMAMRAMLGGIHGQDGLSR